MILISYQCYYCPYNTDDENQYLGHGIKAHLYLPIFPNEADLERYNLTPQGRRWEKCNITVEEAERRLEAWAEKHGRPRNGNNYKRKEKEVNK